MTRPSVKPGPDGVVRYADAKGNTVKLPTRTDKPIKVKGVLYDSHRKVIGTEKDKQAK